MQASKVINAIADLIFAHRRKFLALFVLITIFLGYSATSLRVDAGFNKMIPLEHNYMKVFTKYRETFGGANRVLIALVRKEGDIFNAAFFTKLKQVTDDVFFIPGVDRPTVTSLFTPNVRYIEVVEDGFAGGNVIPADFQGTPEDLEQVRKNILKSGEVGRLVANNLKGALIRAELLEVDPISGKRLDYQNAAAQLEEIRQKHQTDEIGIQIIGFAKAVGDIADGARGVIAFFFLAFLITAALLYWYTGAVSLTAVVLCCALVPVLWLLGVLPLLGFGIDPMSILVPFLIFSIGVSHAVQMAHCCKLEANQGADRISAARTAFCGLAAPGFVALITDALGFLVIMHIKIDIVRELGITASVGLLLMILSNLILLPILLSYLKPGAVHRSSLEVRSEVLWPRVVRFADRRHAVMVIAAAALLFAGALWKEQGLKTGDLGKGVAELHDDSRYNRDVDIITENFSIGVDVLSVIVQTANVKGACTNYDVMTAMDRFIWHMRNVMGVNSVIALPSLAKIVNAGWNEGNLKWRVLSRNPAVLAQSVTPIDTGTGLLNSDCSAMQVVIFTEDHQGETIANITAQVKAFAKEHNTDNVNFLLASGNVGVMVATNEAVDAAQVTMLMSIFGAIVLLCLITFQSWRATLCIVIPLVLVSLMCQALMAILGIGLKVNTLPVIALGVGIGVDYGIYLFERLRHNLKQGLDLAAGFHDALRQRGTAVLFTAMTMTIGVGSWAFSDLKFQSDMGILLAFMFLVNMLGAVLLLPALAAFLVGAPSKMPPRPNPLPQAKLGGEGAGGG